MITSSTKPRVVYFTENFDCGDGWGTFSTQIINGLRPETHAATIFCPKHARVDNPPHRVIKIRRPKPFSWHETLQAALLALRLGGGIDIVHCMVEPFLPLAFRLARFLGARLFIHLHGTHAVLPVALGLQADYQRLYQSAEKIFSNSEYTRQRVLKYFPSLDIDVCHLGSSPIDFPEYEGPKEKYFLFVGDPKGRKGLEYALEAFERFHAERDDYEFKVTGTLHPQDAYCRKISEYLEPKELPVRFLGKVSHTELVNLYQKATANILPSVSEEFYFEGFGLVHLEANLCGTLSIGTRNSANEEVIEDGLSGYLVTQKSSSELYEAMIKAIQAIEHRGHLSAQHCRMHAERYRWETTIASILHFYRHQGRVSGEVLAKNVSLS